MRHILAYLLHIERGTDGEPRDVGDDLNVEHSSRQCECNLMESHFLTFRWRYWEPEDFIIKNLRTMMEKWERMGNIWSHVVCLLVSLGARFPSLLYNVYIYLFDTAAFWLFRLRDIGQHELSLLTPNFFNGTSYFPRAFLLPHITTGKICDSPVFPQGLKSPYVPTSLHDRYYNI